MVEMAVKPFKVLGHAKVVRGILPEEYRSNREVSHRVNTILLSMRTVIVIEYYEEIGPNSK